MTEAQARLQATWTNVARKMIAEGKAAPEDAAKSLFVAGFLMWQELAGPEQMAENMALMLSAMPGVRVVDERDGPEQDPPRSTCPTLQ